MVNFKQLLEKATNGDLSEPDWETILEIVEEVKTKNVSAKNAIKEFRKRLLDSSGNAVYLTVLALDSLMKNCASDVHSEVLSVEFLGVIKAVITSSKDGKSEKAVDKALELIGEWKAAFGDQSGYKAINTVFSELEREGFHIPMAQVASAAFIKKPPEWVLADRCFLCRQEFNRFKGKLRHHCRNCGKSVCATCSGKRAALPHFGVAEATRVCDICHKKVEKGEGASAATAAAEIDTDLPPEYLRSSLAQESQGPASTSPAAGSDQIKEDDDLQLAIAMSLNEQENKSKKASTAAAVRFAPSPSSTPRSESPSAPPPSSTLYANIAHDHSTEPTSSYSYHPPPPATQSQPTSEQSSDPLARYLDRTYWEQRREQQESMAPPPRAAPTATPSGAQAASLTQPVSAGASGSPLAESIRNSIAMFVKRLHEVNSSGTSIATDPVVLSLYQNLTAMQPQLLKQIDEIQQQKAKQLDVINKLNEAKEARVTLNRMRREHQDRVKQQEQEQAVLARMQMEQKLALLRQQKQEQLVFQQSLQNKRLEVLNTQRLEYEQKISMQRELERQQLIAQEQKVLQHQFGSEARVVGPPPPGGQQQPPMGAAGSQHQPPMAGQHQPPLAGQHQPPMGGAGSQHQPPMGGQHQPPLGGAGSQQQLPLAGSQHQLSMRGAGPQQQPSLGGTQQPPPPLGVGGQQLPQGYTGGPQQQLPFGGAVSQQQQQQPYGGQQSSVGGAGIQQQPYGGQQSSVGGAGIQQQPYGGQQSSVGGAGIQQYGASGQQQYGASGGQQQYGTSGGQQQYGTSGGQQQYGASGQQQYGTSGGQQSGGQQQYTTSGGQQQYGGSPKMQPAVTQPYSMTAGIDAPPSSLSLDPASLPMHSLSLHDPNQALPLPSKLEYDPTPTVDPLAPPPYNPTVLGPPESQLGNVYNSYQAPPPQQSYQTPPLQQPPTTYQTPSLQQPTAASYQAPPTQPPLSYQPLPTDPRSFQGQPPGSLYQAAPPQQGGTYYQESGGMQLGGMQLPQSGYGSSSSLPSHPSTTSVTVAQPGGIPHYAPLTTGGYQEAPQVPPAGYQVHQSQFPEQQTAGTFVPNGAHPGAVGRQESEPPLISFD